MSGIFSENVIDDTPLDIIESLRIGLERTIAQTDLNVDKDQFYNGRLVFETGDFDGVISVEQIKASPNTGKTRYKINVKISNDDLTNRKDTVNIIKSMFKRMLGAEYFEDVKIQIADKLNNSVFNEGAGFVEIGADKKIILKAVLANHNQRGRKAINSLDI